MLHAHADLLALLAPDTTPHRVMHIGDSGTGKSTNARLIADHLQAHDARPIYLLHCDPGRALMGTPPGALALARWQDGAWHPIQIATLASMDCLRFRTVLITSIVKLMRHLPEDAHCLLDTPGTTRGSIAAELIEALAQCFEPTQIFHITKDSAHAQKLAMFKALGVHGMMPTLIAPHPEARRPSKSMISSQRLERWTQYISEVPVQTRHARQDLALQGVIELDSPLGAPHFAVAHDSRGKDLGLVLIESLTPTHLTLIHAPHLDLTQLRTLFVRDMILTGTRITTLTSDEHIARTRQHNARPDAALAFTPRERPIYRIDFAGSGIRSGNSIRPTIVGHLFEDPMVVLRLEHRQRCLFLDLGEVRQVPTKMIHQTTDILLSHAHLDHFGDFPWLLRRMAGHTQAMTLHGPPGAIERVANMVHAFTWDRVEDRGPRFEVREIHPTHIAVAWIQAGIDGIASQPNEPRLPNDVIIQEPRQTIRAITLDHGGLESIAYSIEEPHKFGVRGNLLKKHGWSAGPWLGTLKAMAAERRFEEMLTWEDRSAGTQTHSVQSLHDALLIAQPGQKIVYATDFSTSKANHDAVVALAQGADVLICEASFAQEDRDQAERTGHMCASNAGLIAREANVGLLVPFHLSVRYESRPEVVYSEILEHFERVLIPRGVVTRLLDAPREQE